MNTRVAIRCKTRRARLRMATWATWTYTRFKMSALLATMARPTDAKCTTCTRPRTIITLALRARFGSQRYGLRVPRAVVYHCAFPGD
ncbi:hypothetical protein EDB84DRAFT_651300 [Lactarius hengduanensis]|nr:hypothetical protein EDB84DRAFT_651300 [Lactarius hengduanensis]